MTKGSPALRWFVDITALFGTIAAVLWAIAISFAGLAMGWGGRSVIQITLTVTLLIFLPVIASILIGRRATAEAKQGSTTVSILFALSAILCAPVAWVLANLGLFS